MRTQATESGIATEEFLLSSIAGQPNASSLDRKTSSDARHTVVKVLAEGGEASICIRPGANGEHEYCVVTDEKTLLPLLDEPKETEHNIGSIRDGGAVAPFMGAGVECF